MSGLHAAGASSYSSGTNPTYVSGSVAEGTPESVAAVFSSSLTLASGNWEDGFTITADGNALTISSASHTAGTITFTLTAGYRPFTGQALVLAYSGTNITDLEAFTGAVVTNSTTSTVDAPTSLAASPGDDTITLTWTDPSNNWFSQTHVERSVTTLEVWSEVHTGSAETYADTGVTNPNVYDYKVRAKSLSGAFSVYTSTVTERSSALKPLHNRADSFFLDGRLQSSLYSDSGLTNEIAASENVLSADNVVDAANNWSRAVGDVYSWNSSGYLESSAVDNGIDLASSIAVGTGDWTLFGDVEVKVGATYPQRVALRGNVSSYVLRIKSTTWEVLYGSTTYVFTYSLTEGARQRFILRHRTSDRRLQLFVNSSTALGTETAAGSLDIGVIGNYDAAAQQSVDIIGCIGLSSSEFTDTQVTNTLTELSTAATAGVEDWTPAAGSSYTRPSQLEWLDDFDNLGTLPSLGVGQVDFRALPYPKTLGSWWATGMPTSAPPKYSLYTCKNNNLPTLGTVHTTHGSTNPYLLLWVSSRAYQGSEGNIAQGPNYESDAATSVGTAANGNIFPGHWAYIDRRTISTTITAAGPDSVTITLSSRPSSYAVGRYVRIVKSGSAVSGWNNQDWDTTTLYLVTAWPAANQITIAAQTAKTTKNDFSSGDFIYLHEVGQVDATEVPHWWAWNLSTTCPKDNAGAGQDAGNFLANWINDNKENNKNGANVAAVTVHGYVSDADAFTVTDNYDVDIDGVNEQRGIDADGTPLWGNGHAAFYAALKALWAAGSLCTGAENSGPLAGADGNQLETAPNSGFGWSPNPDFDEISKWINNALVHYYENGGGSNSSHFYSKIQDKQYPDGAADASTEWTHGEFGLAVANVCGVFFGRHPHNLPVDPWYDAFAVNIGQTGYTQGPYTYGQAVPKANTADCVTAKGWLGDPLGAAWRVYTEADYADGNEDYKYNAQNDGTTPLFNLNCTLTAGVTELEVSQFNSFTGHQFANAVVRTSANILNVTSGQWVTMCFKGYAGATPKRIRIGLAGAKFDFLEVEMGSTLRWHVFAIKMTETAAKKWRIEVGRYPNSLFIEEIRLFNNKNPNVIVRDFDNGSMVVNATDAAYTAGITLWKSCIRYNGYQNPANDGSSVGTSIASLAADTAYIMPYSQ